MITKSKYVKYMQCPMALWMSVNKPEEAGDDASAEQRMATGRAVGDVAKGIFGDYEDVSTRTADDRPDIFKMAEKTADCLKRNVENICEASFVYEDCFCAVDILHKEGDGYAIYEVKSSTDSKPEYDIDITFQKWVLESSGMKVTGTYLVVLNNQYVYPGTVDAEGNPVYDLNELFTIMDRSDAVEELIGDVDGNVKDAIKVLDKEDLSMEISRQCGTKSGRCAFFDYCKKQNNIPEHSVFELYKNTKAHDQYQNGIVSYEDFKNSSAYRTKGITAQLRNRQLDFELEKRSDMHVDTEGIKAFLGELSYPMYFLDFETMQAVLPEYPNTKPYQQLTFQYSLHYIENEGGELKHKEFLAESGDPDMLRSLAEQLIKDIPQNVCVLAYNMGFEKGRINELAGLFPDIADHLMNIHGNINDLLIPFQQGYCYNRAMGGSFSIKSVLPALFPNDTELDYHNLEGVHNGSEAMSIFPQIKDMPEEEKAEARENLLRYCHLDTLAMVRVWEKLVSLVNA